MLFPQKYTDQELIKGLLSGSNESYRYLDSRYRPIVNKIVRANSGSMEDTKDHYIDVVMKVLNNLKNGKYDPSKGSIKGYFRTIAYRMWINKLRERERKNNADLLGKLYPNTQEESDFLIKLETLLIDCIKQLSLSEQQLIKLRYYDKLPYNTISSQLGHKPNYLRLKMGRAKDKLRIMMIDHGGPDLDFFLSTN